jgi:carbon monoxide dehydrogenase subunit G
MQPNYRARPDEGQNHMEMTGERRIAAPRERVWDALNDPDVLKASIPGCESVERTAEDEFQARVAVKLGPMSARFGGKVTLSNINAPVSYTISGEGQGGAMGFAKGGADVALDELGPDETLLRYSAKAQVGGKMAQLGARLIDSTAKSMADQFFDRFAAHVAAPVAAVAGTDTEYLGDPARLHTSPMTHHGVTPVTGQLPDEHTPAPAAPSDFLPMRVLTSNFLGFPFQVWLGLAAMAVILLLLFAS